MGHSQHQWKFDEYAQQIAKIAHKFDRVVVCVHSACARKGYWLPQFQDLGIECIGGADVFDVNGLLRIKTLFSQFEYMTTNTLGSHVAYAAASGIRVSIFGEYAQLEPADFEKSEFYKLNPHVLEPVLRLTSQSYARATYPQFFCEPSQAGSHVDWALAEIGAENRRSPGEIKKLLGWDAFSMSQEKLKLFSRAVCRGPERAVKRLLFNRGAKKQ